MISFRCLSNVVVSKATNFPRQSWISFKTDVSVLTLFSKSNCWCETIARLWPPTFNSQPHTYSGEISLNRHNATIISSTVVVTLHIIVAAVTSLITFNNTTQFLGSKWGSVHSVYTPGTPAGNGRYREKWEVRRLYRTDCTALYRLANPDLPITVKPYFPILSKLRVRFTIIGECRNIVQEKRKKWLLFVGWLHVLLSLHLAFSSLLSLSLSLPPSLTHSSLITHHSSLITHYTVCGENTLFQKSKRGSTIDWVGEWEYVWVRASACEWVKE